MTHDRTEADSFHWTGRRVAVTGATGFIGYHLCRALTAAGADVTALVRAFSDTSRLTPLGVRCQMAPLDEVRLLTDACRGREFLFHLAGAVDFNNDWDQCRKVNVGGTANILAAATRSGVRRIVHASSIVAVGATPDPVGLDESSHWNLASKRVPYVTTKHEGESLALQLRDGPEVVVINPASVIGPDDFAGSEFGVQCRRFWQGRIPLVFGGGNNFVDVRDVAAGMLRVAERGRAGERYILGGTNLSYTSFNSKLAALAPRPIPRLRLPTEFARLGAMLGDRFKKKRSKRPLLTSAQARLLGLFFYYDCSKAYRELGYSIRPLRDTLADTYRFWMAGKGDSRRSTHAS
ncbi:MAG TPA: NAD-dependent epimerase/dehydratase family protein [Gemmataceae bacterium]|jgi:dihydroflavonol-4-reductase|nr:NAD-dependent epimerase/dehydratase family protein [Gemmataceae bacterium]